MNFNTKKIPRKVQWVFILLWGIQLSSCQNELPTLSKEDPVGLQAGDLLFQDLDCGPLCDAIEKVTPGYANYNFSHMGFITRKDNGEWLVLESIGEGVKESKLKDFLNRSLDQNGNPKVVVGRLKPAFASPEREALKNYTSFLGKPYDDAFLMGSEAYYCSELIFDIFPVKDNPFALKPMTFKDPETEMFFQVWVDYYADQGIAIPEGEPGINPGLMSISPAIEMLYAFGIPSKK